MKLLKSSQGVSLIAAVFIIVILAFMGVIFLTIFTTSSSSSINDLQSARALYVAEGGIERTLFQFRTGTLCGSLSFAGITLGTGNFTTTGSRFNPVATTLSAGGINNLVTVIPVGSTANYAPHGRIRIESEEINYTGLTANSFTGAQRGVAGTAAIGHAAGKSVMQDQCQILSTGTVGSAVRTAEVNAPGSTASSAGGATPVLDTGSIAVGTTATTIATLPTLFPAGDNVIIAVVSFRNTGASRTIAVGNLKLLNGAVLLTSNPSQIQVGGGAAPSATVFPQETQFLLYKDAGALANSTYNVTALASAAGVSAEVKMIVFNSVSPSSFQDGVNVVIGTTETTILTHNSNVPAGDNVIIAAIQLDNANNPNSARVITGGTPGNLKLKKNATVLASNQFGINLAPPNRVNRGTGILLMARDQGAAANPTYTVTGLAGSAGINGAVKIIVLNGLQSASNVIGGNSSGSVALGVAETVIGSLNTSLPAGDNVIIAANQYNNSAAAQRNILATNERIVVGVLQVSSQFDMNLCTSGTPECDDFASGLLWLHAGASPNTTYDVRALASAAGINAETKIMVIHLNLNSSIFGRQ